ncbi:MAG TPA: PIG-L family deacetylase [Dehalococcoidia bacterium]|nr:PIG-L family deacetylase [Dehalococcoidia bacterium]
MSEPAGMSAGPLVVVSPHLDDGVLSCGALLAAHPGSRVITIFAGRPPAGAPLTEWDAAAGFGPRDDVMGARREEDRAALALLNAAPLWLDFCDAQYGVAASVEDIAVALEAAIDGSSLRTVLVPLGLFHSDHHLAADGCLALVRRRPDLQPFAYADVPYRRIPGLLDERLSALAQTGWRLERLEPCRGGATAKRAAVACYRSQLRALGTPGRLGHGDAFAEEWYWRLTPPAKRSARRVELVHRV